MLRDAHEAELELDLALERLKCAIDVLAWYLAKSHSPRRAPMWPDTVVLSEEPLLAWLIFRDPILFDEAKRDVVETMRAIGVAQTDTDQMDLVERLLFSREPAVRRKGGDHVGRDLLIIAAAQLGADWGGWDQNTSKPNRSYSPSSIAKHLCDRLNEHPFLAEFPDAVPTEGTIRSVWSGRSRKLKLLGVSDDVMQGAFVFSALV